MNFSEHIIKLKNSLPASVKLIAVSKYIDSDLMRVAYEAGIRDFGENRVQEAQRKKSELSDLTDVKWHLIGHLQSNKIKPTLETFDFIHSIHSLELAQKVNRIAGELKKKPKLLLQVKLAEDSSKSGFSPTELFGAIEELDELENSDFIGLMTILPEGARGERAFTLFAELASLKEQINQLPKAYKQIKLAELSMGMSSDYLEAIKSGATLIRLGKILFSNTFEGKNTKSID